MASGGETPDVPDESDESGRGQEADAGDAEEVGDGGELRGQGLELAFDLLDAGLDLADLLGRLGEEGPQRVGQIRVRVLDQGPHRRHHVLRSHWDKHPQLPQQAAQGVEARRALRHPALAHSVERGQDLLGHTRPGRSSAAIWNTAFAMSTPKRVLFCMMGSSFASKLRLWHIDADRVAGGVHLINAADEAGAMASGWHGPRS